MLDIAAIIQAADIESILADFGIDLERRRSKHGYELYFECINPQHESTNKRMSISDSGQYKGLFNCWACKASGNILQLVQYFRNCDFKDALFWLKERTGVGELYGTESLKYRIRRDKLNYGIIDDESDKQIKIPSCKTIDVSDPRGKDIAEYLRGRHISEETQRKFGVGYCDYPRTNGSIAVPISSGNNLVSVYFGEAKDGGLKRYPKDAPHGKILFNLDEARECGKYVLVESVLDVLMLDSLGYGPAICCFSNTVTESQLKFLEPFKEHHVMPDMDSPRGWDLVDRMVKGLGKSLWLVLPPQGKDPGNCQPCEVVNSFATKKRFSDWEVERFCAEILIKQGKQNRLQK